MDTALSEYTVERHVEPGVGSVIWCASKEFCRVCRCSLHNVPHFMLWCNSRGASDMYLCIPCGEPLLTLEALRG